MAMESIAIPSALFQYSSAGEHVSSVSQTRQNFVLVGDSAIKDSRLGSSAVVALHCLNAAWRHAT